MNAKKDVIYVLRTILYVNLFNYALINAQLSAKSQFATLMVQKRYLTRRHVVVTSN